MKKVKEAVLLGAGILIGAALLPTAHAAAEYLTASPSAQAIYLDGAQISLEAYTINGSNYVKLRDVGEAVGFNVYWDSVTGTVQIDTASPYTGEAPARQTAAPQTSTATAQAQASTPASYTISTDHWSREDFSQKANPAVFTGVYDRDLYNTIRQTMADGAPGHSPAYTMVAKGGDYSAVKNLIGCMDGLLWYSHYVPQNFTNYWQYLDYFAVAAEMPENYQAPLEFVRPVLAKVSGMGTDREKVEYLNDYLCTLLNYNRTATSGITQTFSPHSGELDAACNSYARAFSFLCAAADIPCFTISTATHTWNMVYADGKWGHVDVSANDLYNEHYILLADSVPTRTDRAPEATEFLKELFVPGSTK